MIANAETVRQEQRPAIEGDPRRWAALPVLLTGAFLPILDFNIVNLALPAIRDDLGATSADLQLVISAYSTTYAVFLITGGRLGDWLGRKRMFTAGVIGFTLASAFCGMARSPGMLVVGRILQALAATIMAPQVLASIRVLFPVAEQGKALALYGATFGLANIVGQILGGVLVTLRPMGFSWQAIFLVNVPIGMAATVGSVLFLTDSKADRVGRMDVGGIVLLSLALGFLVYPLVQGREAGWPWWAVAMLGASPVGLLAFIRFEHSVAACGRAPLVDIALFRQRGFGAGVAMALLFYMLSAFYLTYSVYLQNGLQLSPMDAGLRMLRFGAGYFAASLFAAKLMERLGSRALTLGFFLQVLGFGFVILGTTRSAAILEPGLIVAGVGFGIVMPSVIKAVIGGIDPRHAGLASGIVISTFQVGAALGVAAIGGLFFDLVGKGEGPETYSRAFAWALVCNVALLAVGGLLSLFLEPGSRRAATNRTA
jgi:EmrB/QacA subfamily drug resistance transporter